MVYLLDTAAHLASIAPVDHRDSLLACQRVDVNLVGVPAAMALLFGLGKLRQQQVVALLRKRRSREICKFCETAVHMTAYDDPKTKVKSKQLCNWLCCYGYRNRR